MSEEGKRDYTGVRGSATVQTEELTPRACYLDMSRSPLSTWPNAAGEKMQKETGEA